MSVYQGLELLGKHTVPVHRLGEASAKALLVALVAKYEDLELDEFVGVYLNKRRGGPLRLELDQPWQTIDTEKLTANYSLFGPTISAFVSYPITEEVAEAVKDIKSQNAQVEPFRS